MGKSKDDRQLAFDFDLSATEIADPIAAGWVALRRFHNAVVTFDPAEQAAAREDLTAAAETVDGECAYDKVVTLLDKLRADDHVEPLFGQAFKRVVEIAGCQVLVDYDGFGSLGFMSCHAVDWDAPFISATGFRSVLHTPPYGTLNARGFGVLAQATEHVIARIHADIADKKGKVYLLPILAQWRDIHFGTYELAA